MSDNTTLIQRLRDMSAEHSGGSLHDRKTSKTLDATIRTIENLENLETLNEQQAQVIYDLRIDNSGQAAVIERLQDRIRKLEFALERIRDIDWLQYSNRIDAIQQFAKEALK